MVSVKTKIKIIKLYRKFCLIIIFNCFYFSHDSFVPHKPPPPRMVQEKIFHAYMLSLGNSQFVLLFKRKRNWSETHVPSTSLVLKAIKSCLYKNLKKKNWDSIKINNLQLPIDRRQNIIWNRRYIIEGVSFFFFFHIQVCFLYFSFYWNEKKYNLNFFEKKEIEKCQIAVICFWWFQFHPLKVGHVAEVRQIWKKWFIHPSIHPSCTN